jgi:hypothetical protein
VHYLQEKKPVWDYPVKPGTAEWKAYNSPEEIYTALQVPENILKRIDTESLVQICLDYPATTIFHVCNTPQQGFEEFRKQFNGIRELMSRKDAASFLLKKYASMSLDGFNPLWTLENQGSFVLGFYYMELFLVQVLSSLNESERGILLQESVKKFDMKQSREDLFGGINRGSTIWVMAKTLVSENKLNVSKITPSPELTAHSLESGQLVDFDVEYVYKQAKTLVYE